MKLLGLMQGVSLSGEIQNYLDFVKDDGKKFQLPIPEECVKLLLDEIYRNPKEEVGHVEEPPPEPESDIPEGATQFGGDEEEPEPPPEEPGTPQSEEGIPSL